MNKNMCICVYTHTLSFKNCYQKLLKICLIFLFFFFNCHICGLYYSISNCFIFNFLFIFFIRFLSKNYKKNKIKIN